MISTTFYNKLKSQITYENFVTAFNRRIMQSLTNALESGVEPNLSVFSADFTPEEMDSVTRIFHLSSSLSNTLKECEDLKKLNEQGCSKSKQKCTLSAAVLFPKQRKNHTERYKQEDI